MKPSFSLSHKFSRTRLTKDEAGDGGSYKATGAQQESVVQVEGLSLAGLHDERRH
jgi:hypothetical protein